jgi:hypothetical protein
VHQIFDCRVCHRDGPLDTLLKRLQVRNAYEESVT